MMNKITDMNLFVTREAARDFIIDETKNYCQVQTEILLFLPEEAIFSQEHFTFFCFKLNARYNFSILENSNCFEVICDAKKYSALVLAAENGDLQLFKKEYAKGPSGKALSLAFSYAVMGEKLNILEFYYDANIMKGLLLFKDPLIMATRGDRFNSFKLFLRKGLQLPVDILGPLFHDDSIQILSYIINDSILSKEILEARFQTKWAINGLRKKDNKSTKLFKSHLIGQ